MTGTQWGLAKVRTIRMAMHAAVVLLAGGCANTSYIQESIQQSIETSQICEAIEQSTSVFSANLERVVGQTRECLGYLESGIQEVSTTLTQDQKQSAAAIDGLAKQFSDARTGIGSIANDISTEVRRLCTPRQNCARELVDLFANRQADIIQMAARIQKLTASVSSVAEDIRKQSPLSRHSDLIDLLKAGQEFVKQAEVELSARVRHYTTRILTPYAARRSGDQALRHLDQFLQPIEGALDRLDDKLYGSVSLATIASASTIKDELARMYSNATETLRWDPVNKDAPTDPGIAAQARIGLAHAACRQMINTPQEASSRRLLPLVKSALILGSKKEALSMQCGEKPTDSECKPLASICPSLTKWHETRNELAAVQQAKRDQEKREADAVQQRTKAAIDASHALCDAVNAGRQASGAMARLQCFKTPASAELIIAISEPLPKGTITSTALADSLAELGELALTTRSRMHARVIAAASHDEDLTDAFTDKVDAVKPRRSEGSPDCSRSDRILDDCWLYQTAYEFVPTTRSAACLLNCSIAAFQTRAPPKEKLPEQGESQLSATLPLASAEDQLAHKLKLLSFLRAAWAASILQERSEGAITVPELEPRGRRFASTDLSDRDRRLRLVLRPAP